MCSCLLDILDQLKFSIAVQCERRNRNCLSKNLCEESLAESTLSLCGHVTSGIHATMTFLHSPSLNDEWVRCDNFYVTFWTKNGVSMQYF
jgi:hypothetical protein